MSIVTNPQKGIVIVKERGLRGPAGPSSSAMERVEINLTDPIASPFTYTFTKDISLDANMSPLVMADLNGLSTSITDDFTIDVPSRLFTWISPISLIAGDKLILRYVPTT
ncbi:hypothetical protein EB001_21640 [bacterium]|nr:hypothetical protein [bacterium]